MPLVGLATLELLAAGAERAPVLVVAEDVDSTLRLLLYPLPPPEPGTLSIISPSLGPGPARCPLDGCAIVAASAEAQPYWR